MNAHSSINAEHHSKNLLALAEQAMNRYCLPGARLEWANDGGSSLRVILPSAAAAVTHPYLGKLDKQRLVLKIQAEGADARSIVAELAWLMTLNREADLALPEPVPACDGSLAVAISDGGLSRYFVLFRCPIASFFSEELLSSPEPSVHGRK